MTAQQKRQIFFFLFLAAAGTILIAAGLPRLELQPGIPMPAVEKGPAAYNQRQGAPGAGLGINDLFKVILGTILAVLLAYCIYKFIRGVPWKEILSPALYFTAFTAAVLFILLSITRRGEPIAAPPVETPLPTLETAGPPLGPLPPWLIWAAWIGLGVTLALLAAWFMRRPAPNPERNRLGLEAERALQALRNGAELKSVIIHCYLEMSLELEKDQGIQLKDSMTAREFERLARSRGIPLAPLQQLTGLFEAARYGMKEPGAGDEEKAIQCLNAIVHFAQSGRPAN
jgi:hypothetical protein